jgi:hypothetical protein
MNEDHWEYPLLPYAGTSGWSGSDTSRERAEREDGDGTTSERQRAVMGLLHELGPWGATWKDVAHRFDWHHGQASGALSVLHKAGRIARLAEERRARCAVYVMPYYVGDRAFAPYLPNRAHRLADVSDEDLWAEVARREGWATLDPEAGGA